MSENSRDISIDKIFSVLSQITLFLMVFGGTLSTDKVLSVRFYFYYIFIPPVLLYFVFKIGRVNIYLVGCLALFFLTGLFSVYVGENSFSSLLKIFTSIAIMYVLAYYQIRDYRDRLVQLLKLYLKACVVIVYIAFFQLLSYIVGFKYGYDYSWVFPGMVSYFKEYGGFRASSILAEPSYYALVLSPALFIAICRVVYPGRYNFLISLPETILVFSGFIISVSSSGFLAFFISLLIFVLRRVSFYRILFGALGAIFLLYLIYSYSEEFRYRFENSVALIITNNADFERVDLSSFTLFNHAVITYNNFLNNPVFGTGLGSHASAYDKYTLTKGFNMSSSYLSLLEQNKEDANSMFLRVLSELGLLGIGIFIVFFVCFYIKTADEDGAVSWLTANALLVFFFLVFLRNGHYYGNGVPLFMWAYYFNFRQYKFNKIEHKVPNIE